MRRFNVSAPEFQYDESDPEGYRAGMARFGELLGARRLGGTVYPDSDKIGVWTGRDKSDSILVRRESRTDYWDRE